MFHFSWTFLLKNSQFNLDIKNHRQSKQVKASCGFWGLGWGWLRFSGLYCFVYINSSKLLLRATRLQLWFTPECRQWVLPVTGPGTGMAARGGTDCVPSGIGGSVARQGCSNMLLHWNHLQSPAFSRCLTERRNYKSMDEHRLIPDRVGYIKKFLGERTPITWLLLKDGE